MYIKFKDYSNITKFVEKAKGRYSEAEMASIVQSMLDVEFASEVIIDTIMLQTKPKTILGERLIEHFGSTEAALANIPDLVNSYSLEDIGKLFGFRFPGKGISD